ncbi:MAG: UDPglucose 6-dehydrogenase [Saprospiraceae bacterium]|jgi:UDPglucose 6-dehydrogenase
MNIAVVGTGYVGLVSGTCFAEMGNNVTCVDIDEKKVKTLKNGKVPIYEPQLEMLFERNIKQDRLHFTTSLEEAIKDVNVIFLALPTPPGEDGSADLSYILGVAEHLGKILDKYTVVINKSTVPVGTADKVRAKISENASVEFDVVSNPEFLREGFAVDDFLKPDRVVIGTRSEKAKSIMEDLYKPFTRSGNPIYFMDEKSSELTKYAANSFLATKISFMNEIANVCELLGADVDKVRIGMGSDSRIGKRFLFPGIGYGGSCFPKDVKALIKSSDEVDYDFKILNAVETVNERQKTILMPRIKNYFNGELSGKKIAIWGLAFKPNTDDIREAPAHYMIRELLQENVEVSTFDPEAIENSKEIFGEDITYGANYYDILKDVDALIIATEWSVFRNPDFTKIKSLMKGNVIFDGRNLFEASQIESLGFTYFSIGR